MTIGDICFVACCSLGPIIMLLLWWLSDRNAAATAEINAAKLKNYAWMEQRANAADARFLEGKQEILKKLSALSQAANGLWSPRYRFSDGEQDDIQCSTPASSPPPSTESKG